MFNFPLSLYNAKVGWQAGTFNWIQYAVHTMSRMMKAYKYIYVYANMYDNMKSTIYSI